MATNFIYENEERIKELFKECFQENKTMHINSILKLNVYKYILAYGIICEKRVNKMQVEKLKQESLFLEMSMENIIFFERALRFTTDFLYFDNYMKKLEEKPYFLETWQTWFKKGCIG